MLFLKIWFIFNKLQCFYNIPRFFCLYYFWKHTSFNFQFSIQALMLSWTGQKIVSVSFYRDNINLVVEYSYNWYQNEPVLFSQANLKQRLNWKRFPFTYWFAANVACFVQGVSSWLTSVAFHFHFATSLTFLYTKKLNRAFN